MDFTQNLLNGFALAFSFENLGICFLGTLIGTVTGVLPGIGPTAAMALLIPVSFGLPPTASLILLAGIYYGAMYGGSTTSILLNIPGEAASVVTCIDGYEMAKKGKAGTALAVAAIGSWAAGTAAVIGVMLFAPPLARFALLFGPPEYFSIALLGLLVLSNLSGGSFSRSALVMILGLMLSTTGIDLMSGRTRFTLGFVELSDGIEFAPVIMGLFGLSEVFQVITSLEKPSEVLKVKFRELYPKFRDLKPAFGAMIRGTLIGFPVGLLPGPSGTLSSFAAYRLEKAVSKKPEDFGKGAIQGVAGPESANNSATTASLIPLFALGLPFAPPVAILLSGLMIHGISPGPFFIRDHGNVFWAVIASMYLGNLMLIILNLPLVGVFASLIKTPPRILMPIITALMFVGAYSINARMFDVVILIAFGLFGFLMKKCGFEPAPLIIGLILGKIFEESLRQGLNVVDGNLWLFFSRPITAILTCISFAVFLGGLYKWHTGRKSSPNS